MAFTKAGDRVVLEEPRGGKNWAALTEDACPCCGSELTAFGHVMRWRCRRCPFWISDAAKKRVEKNVSLAPESRGYGFGDYHSDGPF